MKSRGCTKWNHPAGKRPCRVSDHLSKQFNGRRCGWCISGRPPEFTCEWHDPDCWQCAERAAKRPELLKEKSPLWLVHHRYSHEGREERIAAALVGAEQRIADYCARTGNPCIRLVPGRECA